MLNTHAAHATCCKSVREVKQRVIQTEKEKHKEVECKIEEEKERILRDDCL